VALLAVVAAVSGAAASCSSDATTTELADDPADVTVPGNVPTAPDPDAESGLSESGDELLAQLEAIRDETDLCRVLTGEAFSTLLSEEFDVAALVTSPAGVTQLITIVDDTFAQLVAIAPPEVAPSMATIQQVWQRLATSGSGTAEAQREAAAVLAEPQVQAANQNVVVWTALNCPGAAENLTGGT
jgi:hypothetical protein